MRIQILGTGCPKCKQLGDHAMMAAGELGLACPVEKVTDIQKIIEFGVMSTPALAIDGKVVSSGKLLSVEEIKKMLQ